MKSNSVITRIADSIYAEAIKGLQNLSEVKKSQVASIKGKSVDDGLVIISSIVTDIESVLKAPRVDGEGLPAYLSRVIAKENDIETITVQVRTKLKAAYKYHKDTIIKVDDDFVMSVGKAYLDALFEMFYIEQAIENVKELNEKLDTILTENEIPYRFEFAVNVDTDAMVLYIDNNKVVFNASVTRAHDISSLGIFQSGDEYSDYVCKEAVKELVSVLKTIQTTVQLIKGNVSLIKNITGVSTKKRASKIIRGSYHRQAKFLNGVKSGVGYFDETVDINGEEVNVFALVEKDADGNLSVVLNPFNVKDLFNVEYDVLDSVKTQMA